MAKTKQPKAAQTQTETDPLSIPLLPLLGRPAPWEDIEAQIRREVYPVALFVRDCLRIDHKALLSDRRKHVPDAVKMRQLKSLELLPLYESYVSGLEQIIVAARAGDLGLLKEGMHNALGWRTNIEVVKSRVRSERCGAIGGRHDKKHIAIINILVDKLMNGNRTNGQLWQWLENQATSANPIKSLNCEVYRDGDALYAIYLDGTKKDASIQRRAFDTYVTDARKVLEKKSSQPHQKART